MADKRGFFDGTSVDNELTRKRLVATEIGVIFALLAQVMLLLAVAVMQCLRHSDVICSAYHARSALHDQWTHHAEKHITFRKSGTHR